MTAAVVITDLKYTYAQSGFTLLCPELHLPAAEITVITGPNGSGKTTLSKLICGILQPQRGGEVRIFGTAARGLSLGEIGCRIGYLFQNPAQQLVTASVWQEMTFAEQLLEKKFGPSSHTGRGPFRAFWFSRFSPSRCAPAQPRRKQRLALCTILMNGARYFVLDEPTVGLDRANRQLLYEILDELRQAGKGCAIISHSPELHDRYRANMIRLKGGRVLR